MKKFAMGVVCALTLGFASCSTVSTGAGMGFIYTDVSEGEMVTSNNFGKKVGSSEAVGILGLVAIGDASVQTAANSAGITKVSHVDAKKTSILGIFSKYKIFVYGE